MNIGSRAFPELSRFFFPRSLLTLLSCVVSTSRYPAFSHSFTPPGSRTLARSPCLPLLRTASSNFVSSSLLMNESPVVVVVVVVVVAGAPGRAPESSVADRELCNQERWRKKERERERERPRDERGTIWSDSGRYTKKNRWRSEENMREAYEYVCRERIKPNRRLLRRDALGEHAN